jgi:RNA polymerase sigma factor (sigma-70 family)
MSRLPHFDPSEIAHPTFEVLYHVAHECVPGLLRLLKVPPHDIDDVIHDVVVIAQRALPRYRPVDVSDPRRSLTNFLWVIASRRVKKGRETAYCRRVSPRGDVDDIATPLDGAGRSAEEIASSVQQGRILHRVLARISPARAEVLILCAALDMSAPEVAARLGLKENTVKSRLARAIRDVRRAIRRLSRDERQALESCGLLLPFGLGSPPPRPWKGLGASRANLVMSAMVAATLSLGLSGTLPGARSLCATEEVPAGAPIALARNEPTPEQMTPLPDDVAAAAATSAMPPVGADQAPPAAVVRRAPTSTVADEQAVLSKARRAYDTKDYLRALALLDTHARQFPGGALGDDREWQRMRVRAAMAVAPTALGRATSPRP